MKLFGFLLMTGLLIPGSVLSQVATSCKIAAYVSDPHKGVNVRARGGTDAKILGTIPGDPKGTLIFATGSKGDWLKISRAVNSKKKNVFSGVGWIHAPLLFVNTRGNANDLVSYYWNPRTETEDIGGIRAGLEVSVLGCSGDWIRVLIPQRGTEGVPAWLPQGSYCGSPWEDCD